MLQGLAKYKHGLNQQKRKIKQINIRTSKKKIEK